MPDLVPPEIEALYDLAFDVEEEGWESCSATSCVTVEQAEAAVLACEDRHDALRARQQSTLRRVLGEIGAVLRDPVPDDAERVAHIAAIMANGPLDDAPGGLRRARTGE